MHESSPVRSLREIEEWWSIDDLLSANIALDVVDEMNRRARAEAEKD